MSEEKPKLILEEDPRYAQIVKGLELKFREELGLKPDEKISGSELARIDFDARVEFERLYPEDVEKYS